MANTPYQDAVLLDRPLGFWPLDDAAGSTTARDISGNGFSGTIHGTPGYSAPSLPGAEASMRFTQNVANFISAPLVATPQNQALSYEFTIDLSYVSGASAAIVCGVADAVLGSYVYLLGSTGQLVFRVAGHPVTTTPDLFGSIHIGAVTVDASGGLVIYLDGKEVGGLSGVPLPSSPALGYVTGCSNPVEEPNGLVANVASFGYDLSGAQVAAHYAAALTPYQAAVLALGPSSFWTFNDAPGSTIAQDVSGNGNPLAVQGSPVFGSDGAPNGGPSMECPTTSDGVLAASGTVADESTNSFTTGILYQGTTNATSDPFNKGSGAATIVGHSIEVAISTVLFANCSDGVTRYTARVGGLTLHDGNWHLLTQVVDRTANLLTAYCDGVGGPGVSIAGMGSLSDTTRRLSIARMVGSVEGAFVIPSALTAAQVAALHQSLFSLSGRVDAFSSAAAAPSAKAQLAGKSFAIGASLGAVTANAELGGESAAQGNSRGSLAAKEGLRGVAAAQSGATAAITADGHLEGVDAACGKTEGGLWVIPTAGDITIEAGIANTVTLTVSDG